MMCLPKSLLTNNMPLILPEHFELMLEYLALQASISGHAELLESLEIPRVALACEVVF